LPPWARAGTGGRANDPVHQLGHREGPAGLVLQRGQPYVLAWITQLQGNLEHPGEQRMPLGPGLHPHLGKARRGQRLGPVNAHAGRQPPVNRAPRLPVGQHQPTTRPQQPPGLAGRRRGVGGKVQRVNGDHRVGRAISQAGGGQVTDDEPSLLGQPEQRRPVGRLPDGNSREVHPDQRGAARPGQPQPRTTPSTAQVDQRRPRRKAESVGHMTQQADRDKGVRLDLLRQIGAGGLPDPPQARGSGHGGELLVEPGRRGRWRLVAGGRAAVLVLRHPSSSRRSADQSVLASPGRQLAMPTPPAMIRPPDTHAHPRSGG
jgi:hypothetical protein